ncbi:unnamed protein product [Coregonus sp. 'balchen']|nr:unnamed protein product [Coregonus sp. 'balchen']
MRKRGWQAATTMCEWGFKNLFMLSGGLKVIAQTFPEGMTNRLPPGVKLPSPRATAGRKRSPQTVVPASRQEVEVHLRRPGQHPDTPGGGCSFPQTPTAGSAAACLPAVPTPKRPVSDESTGILPGRF